MSGTKTTVDIKIMRWMKGVKREKERKDNECEKVPIKPE